MGYQESGTPRAHTQPRQRRPLRRLAFLLALLLVAGELLPASRLVPIARAALPAFALSAFGGSDQTKSVALGDLNGDGALDIVKGEYRQSLIFLNDGHGHFADGSLFGSANNTLSVALGDLNGDGALDIVQGNYGTL